MLPEEFLETSRIWYIINFSYQIKVTKTLHPHKLSSKQNYQTKIFVLYDKMYLHKIKKTKTCIFQKELYKYLIIYLDITFWLIFAVNGPSLTRIIFGFRIAITRGRLVSTQVTFIQMTMMLKITTKNIYLRYIVQFYSVFEVYLSSFIGISMNRDFPSLKEIWMFAQNCIENLNPNYLCFICFFSFCFF